MTIAAGILCSDGIVLCSDTEETISEERKINRAKMLVVQPQNWIVGLAGAGHSDWILAFIQGMGESFFDKIGNSRESIKKLDRDLRVYAEDFFLKYIRAYAENPQHRPQVHMLICIQSNEHHLIRKILRVNDNAVLDSELNTCVAVGTGAPLFEHYAENIIGDHSYNVKQAASIAVYILEKVKSSVSGCGGNSHIVMLGRNSPIEWLTTRRVKGLELLHADAESRMYKSLAEQLIKVLP
ncbi:MAG: hypothetical protein ACYDB3_11550 [Acidimicrobiales bacterium]